VTIVNVTESHASDHLDVIGREALPEMVMAMAAVREVQGEFMSYERESSADGI
jgi:hypothetical protein